MIHDIERIRLPYILPVHVYHNDRIETLHHDSWKIYILSILHQPTISQRLFLPPPAVTTTRIVYCSSLDGSILQYNTIK